MTSSSASEARQFPCSNILAEREGGNEPSPVPRKPSDMSLSASSASALHPNQIFMQVQQLRG